MTTEQMKDEAITVLRRALQKVMATHLAQAEDIRLILDMTDPVKRKELRARVVQEIRRVGIG